MNFEQQFSILKENILHSTEPLHVTFVGEFTVGKSSLINALIKQEILPTALQETTARSTLIRYGVEQKIFHVTEDGPIEISLSDLQSLAKTTGEGDILVELPLKWLESLWLYDLPGTGGNDQMAMNHTKQQIAAADVVVHLIFNRGPNRRDIEMLQEAQRRGKIIIPLITKWDQVVNDTYTPPLGEWNQKITQAIGQEITLSPISITDPLLIENVQRQLHDITTNQHEIRLQRLISETLPLLEQYHRDLQQEQQLLRRKSTNTQEELEDEIENLQDQLIDFEATIEKQQIDFWTEEQQQFEMYRTQSIDTIGNFCRSSHAYLEQNFSEAEWQKFCQNGINVLNASIDNILQQINKKHLTDIERHAPSVNIQLSIPKWKVPALEDLRQAGERTQFLQDIQQMKQVLEQLDYEPTLDTEPDEQRLRQEMLALQEQMRATLSEPLPLVKQDNGGTGKMIGSFLGGVADLALMLIPAGAIAQGVAKGAQSIGLISKVTKVTKSSKLIKQLSTGVKTLRSAQLYSKTGKIRTTKNTPKHVHNLEAIQPSSSILDMLSLSYWGGVVGEMIDGPPNYIQDPAALNQQRLIVAELKQQKHQLAYELTQLQHQKEQQQDSEADKRRLTLLIEDKERALKQHERNLQIELTQVQQRADSQNKASLSLAVQQMQTRLENQALMQLRGIENAILDSLQKTWKEDIASQTESRRKHLHDLSQRIKAPNDDTAERLRWIEQEIPKVLSWKQDLSNGQLPL